MTYIGRNHRGVIKHLEPAEFSSDTNAILNLMDAVYDLWDESDPIRKDWIKWHEEHRLDVMLMLQCTVTSRTIHPF